jgi:hypothetical protein
MQEFPLYCKMRRLDSLAFWTLVPPPVYPLNCGDASSFECIIEHLQNIVSTFWRFGRENDAD